MIRAFLRLALPVAAVGAAAAALVGPSLIAGPRGEALVLAAPDAASPIAQASLAATDCAALELLAAEAPDVAGQVLALRLPADEELAIARIPDGAGSALLVIFDRRGALVPLTGGEALGELAAALSRDCGGVGAEPDEAAGAI